MNNGAYSVIAPLIPIEFERKGVTGIYTGIVFAMFSVGVILMAP